MVQREVCIDRSVDVDLVDTAIVPNGRWDPARVSRIGRHRAFVTMRARRRFLVFVLRIRHEKPEHCSSGGNSKIASPRVVH